MRFLETLAKQFAGKPIDWDELEESLIRADLGVPMTMRIIKTLQEREAWALLGIGDVIKAVREEIAARAPALAADEAAALARLASGRLDRAARLLDPKSAKRRDVLLEVARSVYSDPEFDPRDAALRILDGARERAADAKADAEQELELLALPAREAEQRVRRAARGAERDELLAALEELASWYRDLVVVAVGAERAVVHADRLPVLAEDGTTERLAGAERACEIVRETWRAFEEFNLSPPLALEALFVRLRRELGAAPALV